MIHFIGQQLSDWLEGWHGDQQMYALLTPQLKLVWVRSSRQGNLAAAAGR